MIDDSINIGIGTSLVIFWCLLWLRREEERRNELLVSVGHQLGQVANGLAQADLGVEAGVEQRRRETEAAEVREVAELLRYTENRQTHTSRCKSPLSIHTKATNYGQPLNTFANQSYVQVSGFLQGHK